MGLPAARDKDPSACSHGPTPIDASSTAGVNVNGRKAGKTADPSGCPGKFITTGSSTVKINARLAARMTDLTTDGQIILGSLDVFIGGPRAGDTIGALGAQTKACEAAAATRASGKKNQSAGNCGLEAWRNTINRDRARRGLPPMTEQQLLDQALSHKPPLAVNNPGHHNHGATNANDRGTLLKENGIETEQKPQSVEALRDEVEAGKAVSVTIHPYHWGSYVTEDWWHEVAVTGIEYDDKGQIAAIYINDTGLGTCGDRIPIEQMKKNMPPGQVMTVSKEKQW